MYLALFNNATVTTGLTYTDVNTANSVISYNASGTSTMTAGTGISQYSSTCVGQNSTIDLTDHDIFMSPGDTLCFAARLNATGTIATSVTMSFSEWQ
jgi:hypothetical protein